MSCKVKLDKIKAKIRLARNDTNDIKIFESRGTIVHLRTYDNVRIPPKAGGGV